MIYERARKLLEAEPADGEWAVFEKARGAIQ